MREVSQVSTDNRRGEHGKADMQAASFLFWKSQKGGTSLTQLCPLPKLAPNASTLQPTQLISYSGRSQPDTAQLW